ncbi:MAG: hypothetical protein JRJ84_24850, partial [Deltaproteobacteria bacterium]|nr:hypothetical protein [Deltaproteobacteria bacterium]
PSWRSADLTKEQMERVEAQVAVLFGLASDAIRSGYRTRRRLCRILAKRVQRSGSAELTAEDCVAAWLTAPLLERPQGEASLRQVAARLRADSAVVWGTEPADGALVLLGSGSNQALLGVVGLASQVQPLRRWRRKVERAQRERHAAEREKAARVARDALQRCLQSRADLLLMGIEDRSTVIDDARTAWQEPQPDDALWPVALEDPQGPAGWLVCWRGIDAALTAQGLFEDATEVAVRVAERLAKAGGES